MKDLLNHGFNPNRVLRRGKYPVHFCVSMDMIRLLLEYDLDLTINEPLLKVPFNVFKELIEDYKLDPYEYYRKFTSTEKIKYINNHLRHDRRILGDMLYPLGHDLNLIVVDYVYITPQ